MAERAKGERLEVPARGRQHQLEDDEPHPCARRGLQDVGDVFPGSAVIVIDERDECLAVRPALSDAHVMQHVVGPARLSARRESIPNVAVPG